MLVSKAPVESMASQGLQHNVLTLLQAAALDQVGAPLAPVSLILVRRCYKSQESQQADTGWAGGQTRDGAALRTDHVALLGGGSPSAPVPRSVPFSKYILSPLDLSSPRK